MGYSLLCKIVAEHAYQAAGEGWRVCVPSAQSVDWMRRRDVLVRALPDGIALWCETARRTMILEEGQVGEVLLGFRWYARDPWFSLYTHPVEPSADSVLFLRGQAQESDEAAAGWRRWPARAEAFVGLGDIGLARHLDRQDQLRKPVMVTEIDLATLAATEEGAEPGLQLKVSFAARASRWKYCFFSTMQTDPGDLAVVDLDGEMEFVCTGTESFPGGQRAVVFLSQREIVMQAQYPQRFQLRERSKTGERVLMARLPNADIRKVTRNAIDGETALVSEIYIN